MDYYTNDHYFLQEFLSLTELEDFNNDGGCYTIDCFENNSSNTRIEDYYSSLPIDHQTLNLSHYAQFGEETKYDTQTLSYHQQFDDVLGNVVPGLDSAGAPFKAETIPEMPGFNIGVCPENDEGKKKVSGLPSKNLMAERRRRKRLNDRLSMLRSVVPKISKMDRTSILGDTVEYMKELLERVNNLQQEMDVESNQLGLMTLFKDVKTNEILVRNSPKFDVERVNSDTRINVSCVGKPGLLVSTMSSLESLGLEIQQCVISCFNDFTMHASCSEDTNQKKILNPESIKQALFRNAGYGGKCLL